MINGPRVVDSFDVSSWDDPPGRRSVLEVLDDGTTRTVLVHDEVASAMIDSLANAKRLLDEPIAYGPRVLILTPEQRADVERMQAEHARLRDVEDRARAAPCRAARWRPSTWAPCDRCGGQTRAVYLDGQHRHMICEARR